MRKPPPVNREFPPRFSSGARSSRVTLAPASEAASAAQRAALPPPTTTTSKSGCAISLPCARPNHHSIRWNDILFWRRHGGRPHVFASSKSRRKMCLLRQVSVASARVTAESLVKFAPVEIGPGRCKPASAPHPSNLRCILGLQLAVSYACAHLGGAFVWSDRRERRRCS